MCESIGRERHEDISVGCDVLDSDRAIVTKLATKPINAKSTVINSDSRATMTTTTGISVATTTTTDDHNVKIKSDDTNELEQKRKSKETDDVDHAKNGIVKLSTEEVPPKKRKTRRGKNKKQRNHPQHYHNNNNNNSNYHNQKKREMMMKKLVRLGAEAPYNSNRFLIEDHQDMDEIDERLKNDEITSTTTYVSRTRDSSFSIDSDGGEFYSTPDDEEEFLIKDFDVQYKSLQQERLNNLTKIQLIQEYLLLQDRLQVLNDALKAKPDRREYEKEIERLSLENEKFRKDNENLRVKLLSTSSNFDDFGGGGGGKKKKKMRLLKSPPPSSLDSEDPETDSGDSCSSSSSSGDNSTSSSGSSISIDVREIAPNDYQLKCMDFCSTVTHATIDARLDD